MALACEMVELFYILVNGGAPIVISMLLSVAGVLTVVSETLFLVRSGSFCASFVQAPGAQGGDAVHADALLIKGSVPGICKRTLDPLRAER